MKRFKFIMDNEEQFLCIARDFQSACLMFDQAGLDPQSIAAIEEHE